MTQSPQLYREQIVEMLVRSFQNNPTLKALTSQHNPAGVRNIIEYSFDFARRRDGIMLSDEKNCAVLFYKNSSHPRSVYEYLQKLRLLVTTLPFRKLLNILFHLNYINSARGAKGDFYYLWYLGSSAGSRMIDTRKFILEIFEKADSENLPIYAETTLLKNKLVFERYGFKTYKTWYNRKLDIRVYFMKREVVRADI